MVFASLAAAAGRAHGRRGRGGAGALPFVLDVRDIWPAAAEALGELSNARVLAAFERAERWLYRNAAAVTATTAPFCAHIDARRGPARQRAPAQRRARRAASRCRARAATPARPFTVGYAGNFGIAQGLGIVLDAADELRGEDVRFVLVGERAGEGASLRGERDRRGLADASRSGPASRSPTSGRSCCPATRC